LIESILTAEAGREAGCVRFDESGRGRIAPLARSCPMPPVAQGTQRSGGLDDLAGPNAGRADAQGFPGPVDQRVDPLKIGVPPAPGDVVSVAHSISVRGTFAANFTVTRH